MKSDNDKKIIAKYEFVFRKMLFLNDLKLCEIDIFKNLGK